MASFLGTSAVYNQLQILCKMYVRSWHQNTFCYAVCVLDMKMCRSRLALITAELTELFPSMAQGAARAMALYIGGLLI